jgi:hypothetical protein
MDSHFEDAFAHGSMVAGIAFSQSMDASLNPGLGIKVAQVINPMKELRGFPERDHGRKVANRLHMGKWLREANRGREV